MLRSEFVCNVVTLRGVYGKNPKEQPMCRKRCLHFLHCYLDWGPCVLCVEVGASAGCVELSTREDSGLYLEDESFGNLHHGHSGTITAFRAYSWLGED